MYAWIIIKPICKFHILEKGTHCNNSHSYSEIYWVWMPIQQFFFFSIIAIRCLIFFCLFLLVVVRSFLYYFAKARKRSEFIRLVEKFINEFLICSKFPLSQLNLNWLGVNFKEKFLNKNDLIFFCINCIIVKRKNSKSLWKWTASHMMRLIIKSMEKSYSWNYAKLHHVTIKWKQEISHAIALL